MKEESPGSATDFYGTLPNAAKKSGPNCLADHLVHFCFRAALWCYVLTIRLGRRIRPQRPFPASEPVEILLTGTFFSDNWIVSLLRPLALSSRCGRIRMVSSTPVPDIEKVEPVYPPRLLTKIIGRSPARLATFLWLGFRTRPHLVGGLHLLVNGLTAILLAKLTGARALYSCCGGPIECEGGGYKADNHLFCKLRWPDPVVERFLLEAVAAADLVITRGNSAIRFFQKHGVSTRFHVVPGGMDGSKFFPSDSPAEYDLIMVGNLIPRKRVDIFLQIVSQIKEVRPDIRAVILGDGPLRKSLEALSGDLALQENVHFAGHQKQVDAWLKKAKIFVLTSESEGLSQAMIQAMLCGLPAVVSRVGEAADLVENGLSGFLINDLKAEQFVEPIVRLLGDASLFLNCSRAAKASAERCELHYLARQWNCILAELDN